MAEQSVRERVRSEKLAEEARFDAAWLKLRRELQARIDARFGVASDDQGSASPDPDLLADMALERAWMP